MIMFWWLQCNKDNSTSVIYLRASPPDRNSGRG